jgi:hypothetical protein
MTKTEILKRLITRKRGATSFEIATLMGTVCPHRRLTDLKEHGWTILRKEIDGQSYGRYFGIAPKVENPRLR